MNFALCFSRENNIVKSNEWANLIPENGINGGSNKGKLGAKGWIMSKESRKIISDAAKKRTGIKIIFYKKSIQLNLKIKWLSNIVVLNYLKKIKIKYQNH